MKNYSPKKSFSSFGKGDNRKTSDRPFKKGSSSSRPYVPNTPYGSNKKSSSYRGKHFREESVEKGMVKPGYSSRETSRAYPTTRATTASSSPKSVYIKTTHTERTERVFRTPVRTGSRNSVLPTAKKSVSSKPQANSHKLTADNSTSWGSVADWYNKHLETNTDSYHAKVVFPSTLRILGDLTGKKVLDLACGQGIFADKLRAEGAFVTGVDISKELIGIAELRNDSVKSKGTHKITYHVTSADDLYMLKDKSFDIVVCILALQNIENLQKTIQESSRVLNDTGRMVFVINHPSFRNPQHTHWGYDDGESVQYRRVDEYMSESRIKIDMTPGSFNNKKFTTSFHRPLQVYSKLLFKNNLTISHLEEWTSHKESEKGPRQKAENKARKEIPLFMCIEARKARG